MFFVKCFDTSMQEIEMSRAKTRTNNAEEVEWRMLFRKKKGCCSNDRRWQKQATTARAAATRTSERRKRSEESVQREDVHS